VKLKNTTMKSLLTIICLFILSAQVNAQQCQSNFYWFQDSSTTQTVIAINNSTGSGVLSYYWDFGDGNTSQLAYPSHQYAALGSYEVCLTIMDNDPVGGVTCTSIFCDTVFVTFKSSGFVINVYPESVLNSNEVALENVTFFPNPVKDVLFLNLDINSVGREINISDNQGKIVFSDYINLSSIEVDVRGLESGIYFLNIDGVGVKKFFKEE
jgi:hypothetical protein